MDKDIITLDTAILAHEKGFKFNRSGNDISYTRDFEPNDFRYLYNRLSKKYLLVSDYYAETNQNIQQYIHSKDHPVYDAPLQYELQKWLREKHGLHIIIDTTDAFDKTHPSKYRSIIRVPFHSFRRPTPTYDMADTYEEVLEISLQRVIKKIKHHDTN